MKHQPWRWLPDEGGLVSANDLAWRPVDPVMYSMCDLWGFDIDELPIDPFDIEIRITAPSVLEGLRLFETAVAKYMMDHFEAFNRSLVLERLVWNDPMAEQRCCEIFMAD